MASDTQMPRPLVLVVDDDEASASLVRRWLEGAGIEVRCYGSAEDLREALKLTLPDAICLDIGLPGIGGLDALETVRSGHRTVPVLMLTADGSVDTVVDAMNRGAYDYLTKPVPRARLVTSVLRAVEHHQACTRLAQLERAETQAFGNIVGASAPMRRLFGQLEKLAASDVTVLIQGESGSGKELVARAIHEHSARREGPFIAINCAAVPETLQDSVLFGHEKGAFTGAQKAKAGLFEMADGGTLFLDEVAELSPSLQAKLLRVIQERSFERIGGRGSLSSDFRLVTASHRDLTVLTKERSFREDLFFRLAVLEVRLPPLREREGDLPLLVEHILGELAAGGRPHRVESGFWDALEAYRWPGNVRELQNVLQRAVVLSADRTLRVGDLPPRLQAAASLRLATASEPAPGLRRERPLETSVAEESGLRSLAVMTLDELERWAIEAAMERTGGNLSEVVRQLGIGRTTLYRKLKRYRQESELATGS